MPLQIPLPTAGPYTDIAQYVPLLISSIEGFLQARDVWATADYPQAYSYMEDLKAYLVENLPPMTGSNGKFWQHWHIGSKVNSGTAIGLVIDTAQIGAHVARQNPTVQFDETQFELPLKAGNYTLRMIYRMQPSAGIVSVILPLVTMQSFDLYSAATVNNAAETFDFTIPADTL